MLRVAEFVHLHVHTEYSLLDGMIKIPDLIERAEKFQMPAVSITDHGNLFGAVKFYEEAKKAGLKPIVGCEVYVAPKSRFERDRVGNHLVLLCKNHQGYQNLCRLVTAGYLEGFYYKPRIDLELLAAHNEGLIALSACLKGAVPEALMVEDHERAEKAAGNLKDIFDNGRFYFELQDNGIKDQIRVNRELIAMGSRMDIEVVATNDCHYLQRDQARAHEVLLCIQTGKNLSDEKRMRLATDEFYFRSPGEMKEKFGEVPRAITNTLEIANHCNLEWNLETKHFPRFPVEDGMTLRDMLVRDANKGFETRLSELSVSDPEFGNRREEYEKRLEYELQMIREMGFSGYFLIVSDFVNWAKSQGISVGPGRGSAAGSLVSYCLGITDINPMAYGLIFERFLNPERREMPDIDVDFCQERRDEVLSYVTRRYGGSEYVAQIITFGTMKARAVVRDVGRVLGVPYGEVDRIAKLIPKNADLAEALQQEPRLKELKEKDPGVRELLSLAEVLEGISRHASTHAAGVVISDKPLIEYLPLYKDPKEESVVAQYDMKCVEKVGLIKFDLLGLKTLTQIRYCVQMIQKNRQESFDASALPMNDKPTYELLSRGDTGGVFQLESSGMKDLLQRLSPNRFEDLIAVVALYRPGPLGSGYVDKFIERKHGREEVSYALPQMQEVLNETYGVLVYQEQVMEIAVKLAGYTMGEADSLRKAMGKKIQELMEAQEDKFISGTQKQKIDEKKAHQVFDDMAQFAKYGFNKSHAAAYAYVAYQTAYLKAHYPVEFMASLLTMDMNDTDKVMKYLRECEDKKIKVEPPHVNAGTWQFAARGQVIEFGLGAVKGVGKSAVEAIQEARETGGPFNSLFDFCERVDLKRVNRRTIESLVKAGAFDDLGTHRSRLMAAIESALEHGHKVMAEREAGQTNLFDMLGDSGEKDFMAANYPEAEPWTSREMLANEKEALGYYLTGHPLARFEETMSMLGIVDTSRIPFLASGQEVLVGGMVTSRKEHISKKKERMAFVTITDLKGDVEVVVFASVYKDAVQYLENEDVPVLIKGRVEINEDKAKMLAGEIFPLEEAAERLSLTLHLKINRPMVGPEEMESLARILKTHRGRAKVVVHVLIPDRSEITISLPVEYRASPDQKLIQALREQFGEEAVFLEAA